MSFPAPSRSARSLLHRTCLAARAPRARSLAALALAAGLLAACSREGGAPAASGGSASQVSFLASAPTPPFLERMVDAPERVAHGGLRRVEYHLAVDGVPTSLVYDERITADGAGRYAIEPVSVASPALSQPQREVFDELQRARQGFFFKYRDLRVRNWELFQQNYSVRVEQDAPVVAGVECVEIEITPRDGSARSYRLAVEADSGLVLRALERDESGAIVAATMFLEFTRQPVLDGVAFHVERYPGTPLAQAALSPGFTPARPQVLPAGYREVSSELVEVAGDTYARRVYGDGLENVFFLERRGAPGSQTAPLSASAGTPENVTVRLAQLGSFRVAEVARGNGGYFVVGKVSEADVLAILRSAL